MIFKIRIPDRVDWENGSPLVNLSIIIYADGSKMEQVLGVGVYSESLGISMSYRDNEYSKKILRYKAECAIRSIEHI